MNNEGIQDRKSGNNICMNYVEDKHMNSEGGELRDSGVLLLPEPQLEMSVTAECYVEQSLELDVVSNAPTPLLPSRF